MISDTMRKIDKWAEKAHRLRKLTGLKVEIDEYHFTKTNRCHLDVPVFIVSLCEIGYQGPESIESFLAGLFCEEAKELFMDIL